MTAGEAMIATARGDTVRASELGFTLSAELIIQETPEMSINWPDYSWGGRPEEERIVPHEGIRPFMTVRDKVISGLKALGVSDADITILTETNPQRFLSTLAKGAY